MFIFEERGGGGEDSIPLWKYAIPHLYDPESIPSKEEIIYGEHVDLLR